MARRQLKLSLPRLVLFPFYPRVRKELPDIRNPTPRARESENPSKMLEKLWQSIILLGTTSANLCPIVDRATARTPGFMDPDEGIA